jgi:hypothetical protein
MILKVKIGSNDEKVFDIGKERKSIGKIIPVLKTLRPFLMKIEFNFNGRTAFSYHIKNFEHLSKIYPFISFCCSTTAYNVPSNGIGFIDRYKNLRVEFYQGSFVISQL